MHEQDRKKNTDEVMISEEEINRIASLGIDALRGALVVVDELGEDGLTRIGYPNEKGDQPLNADVLSEAKMFDYMSKAKFPGRTKSEEHPTMDLTENPVYTVFADGIDGTSQYMEDKGRGNLRYATMLGIASGLDPNYVNYIFSGIIIHSTKELFVGIRGEGSFLIGQDNNRIPIETSGRTVFDKTAGIYSMQPDFSDLAKELFGDFCGKYVTQSPLSEAVALADVASGKADIAVELTRFGNLEQMIAYGLINEAGGVMVDKYGRSIGDQKYYKWGQEDVDKPRLLVTAATQKLAEASLEKLKEL